MFLASLLPFPILSLHPKSSRLFSIRVTISHCADSHSWQPLILEGFITTFGNGQHWFHSLGVSAVKAGVLPPLSVSRSFSIAFAKWKVQQHKQKVPLGASSRISKVTYIYIKTEKERSWTKLSTLYILPKISAGEWEDSQPVSWSEVSLKLSTG